MSVLVVLRVGKKNLEKNENLKITILYIVILVKAIASQMLEKLVV